MVILVRTKYIDLSIQPWTEAGMALVGHTDNQ
jgi:hypothetical protein